MNRLTGSLFSDFHCLLPTTAPLAKEGDMTRKHPVPEKSGCMWREDDRFSVRDILRLHLHRKTRATGSGVGGRSFLEGLLFPAKNGGVGLAGLVMAFLSKGALSGALHLFHRETRYILPIRFRMMIIIFFALSQQRKDANVP